MRRVSRSRNSFPSGLLLGVGRKALVTRHVPGPMAEVDAHRRSAGTEGLQDFRRSNKPWAPARRVEKRMRQNRSVSRGVYSAPQRNLYPQCTDVGRMPNTSYLALSSDVYHIHISPPQDMENKNAAWKTAS